MTFEWFHPSVVFIVGAVLVLLLRGGARKALLLAVPLVSIALVFRMHEGDYWRFVFLGGQEVLLGHVDRLSLVFSYVFTVMALIGAVYALHVDDPGQHAAAFLYVGSSLGVVFAGDYLSLFVFWEIMAFASAYLVFARRDPAAIRAAFRYILVHIFGGAALLGGILLNYHATGSLLFGPPAHGGGLGFYLILVGFILNAAVPPIHAWLADAYPEATVTGAVFMCAFTTKTAVYVLVRAFPGTEILAWLGAAMAIYGVVYAFLSDDYRRLLSYHIISQVGFMVAGIGIGTEMALNGAVAHAFSHILYKGLLFMAAGSVLFMTGKRRLTDLGGLYKTMPVTLIMYMVGALSISGWPLLSGFVSKSMVISAASHDHKPAIFFLLTLASVGTFLSLGLKLPYHMFFSSHEGPPASEPPKNMLVAMGMAAFLCALIGVFPSVLYRVLPHEVEYAPYTADHVTGALQILLFTALGYVLLHKYAKAEASLTLDTDWFYRKGSRVFMWVAGRVVAGADGFVSEIYDRGILMPARTLASWSSGFDLGVIDGIVNAVAYLTRLVAWAAHKFDIYIVDGLVNSSATLVGSFGAAWRRLQSGYVQNYALVFVLGLIIIIGSVLLG